ncbi:cupin domain-containing protein [Patulibacter medicamentivorans]|uniref:cupin domain-containing protein n=1 Tax=Patulibacter medicamentivorans TaxID=1097667 RepID=UPI0011103D69|nr:cupin domain-containing protein [Patulibacter medicamentivorans]
MPSRIFHARLEDLPKETTFEGTYQRTGVVSDHALFAFAWVDAGFGADWAEDEPFPNMHSHEHDQLMVQIRGEQEMVVGDEQISLRAGEVLYIPSRVLHGGRPVGDEPTFLIEAFAPIRTDYLYIAEHQLSVGAPERLSDGSRVDTKSKREAMSQVLSDSGLPSLR